VGLDVGAVNPAWINATYEECFIVHPDVAHYYPDWQFTIDRYPPRFEIVGGVYKRIWP
jgi:hypothetical protein